MWQRGTPVKIAVFQQRVEKGKTILHVISDYRTTLEEHTLPDLLDHYPPDQGFGFSVRREGDDDAS